MAIDERLLLERIEDAKRRGRKERAKLNESLRSDEEKHEREYRERCEAIERETERVLETVPKLVQEAEKWNRRTATVHQLHDSDFSRAVPPNERKLVGVAKRVFEQCEQLKLRPQIKSVSDSCMEWPDAGSHFEIVISWDE